MEICQNFAEFAAPHCKERPLCGIFNRKRAHFRPDASEKKRFFAFTERSNNSLEHPD